MYFLNFSYYNKNELTFEKIYKTKLKKKIWGTIKELVNYHIFIFNFLNFIFY